MEEINNLIEEAQEVYKKNFDNTTCFERAIFFSWGCRIGDCTYCYMSTQPKKEELAKRSVESLIAETILCKKLGWDIGFLTGGMDAYKPEEFYEILEIISKVYDKKIWTSVGPLSKELVNKYSKYSEGFVGSIETVNKELHKKVCPSKSIEPYEKMFNYVNEINGKTAMTMILGLGETKEDFEILKKFIEKHKISKIHLYGLIPHEGTAYENAERPSVEYQAWWIAKTRIAFPKMDIQAGIWSDRLEYIPLLLKAGANSLSKLRAIDYFGTEKARKIEQYAKEAGREFKGTLTDFKLLDSIDLDDIPDCGPYDKKQIKLKLEQYVKSMRKNEVK
jgi:biotin synthase-like enzyme